MHLISALECNGESKIIVYFSANGVHFSSATTNSTSGLNSIQIRHSYILYPF